MTPIQLNDAYIDAVVEYLNELLDLEPGKGPERCGMCTATDKLTGHSRQCRACPIDVDRVGFNCAHRGSHLVRDCGMPTDRYSAATKKSIETRVRWIAEEVNKHESNYKIHIVEDK